MDGEARRERVSGIGPLLRAYRLRQGGDLGEAAATLNIRLSFLEAIEDGRYADLPGPAYASGFVRAYAEYLGLDSDEVVRRFKAETVGTKTPAELHFPTPSSDSAAPQSSVLLIGALIAVVAYGAWYVSTARDGFLGDLVPPLPDRLASLLSRDDDDAPRVPRVTQSQPVAEVEIPAGVPARRLPTMSAPTVTADAPSAADDPSAATLPSEPSPTGEPDAPASPRPATSASRSLASAETAPPPATAPAGTEEAESTGARTEITRAETTTADGSADDASRDPAESPMAESTFEAPAPVREASVRAESRSGAEPGAEPATSPAPVTADDGERQQPSPPRAQGPMADANAPVATGGARNRTDAMAAEAPNQLAALTTATVGRDGGAADGAAEDDGRVVLHASEQSWVEIRDRLGNRVMSRLMAPGEVYEVPDQSGLRLTVGNAGGIAIQVDGTTVPPLGGSGVVRRNVPLEPERLQRSTSTTY